MPNAKDATGVQPHKFLLLGATGTGKTSQFLTLPGKKFAYLFDPNALLSLRGYDIEYETFYPEMVSLDVKSLKKETSGDQVMGRKGSEAYLKWEKDFDKKVSEKFFDQFDVIGMDSCPTFLDLIMDRVLTINGRPGQWPQQDDYGPQMVVFTNVVRTLTGMGKMIFFTGHHENKQDELTQRIFFQPLMTGRLREKIPLLFSDIFCTTVEQDQKGKVQYNIQTVSSRQVPTIRSSIKGLATLEDVTIDWAKPPEQQGLGRILHLHKM